MLKGDINIRRACEEEDTEELDTEECVELFWNVGKGTFLSVSCLQSYEKFIQQTFIIQLLIIFLP